MLMHSKRSGGSPTCLNFWVPDYVTSFLCDCVWTQTLHLFFLEKRWIDGRLCHRVYDGVSAPGPSFTVEGGQRSAYRTQAEEPGGTWVLASHAFAVRPPVVVPFRAGELVEHTTELATKAWSRGRMRVCIRLDVQDAPQRVHLPPV